MVAQEPLAHKFNYLYNRHDGVYLNKEWLALPNIEIKLDHTNVTYRTELAIIHNALLYIVAIT